jgi:hypothetical protein
MQTFLVSDDFEATAKVLDRQRLGKQRVEVIQILKALNGQGGWQNHPAVKMWKGFEKWLAKYGLTICAEWIKRGYKDTCYDKIFLYYNPDNSSINWMGPKPPFLSNQDFFRSHKSNLIRKKPEYYRPLFGNDIPDNLPYIWPV